ncbi:MAG: TIR domain-containing protein [Anaerolineae bacterium]|nr:TIR domain-containing protein [Anaerolineae bacterium]
MRLFISYARDDRVRVEKVVALLREAGHETWFDKDLIVGQEWQEELKKQIDENDAFVYLLTPKSIASEWCQWEFSKAVAQGKPIIPILLEKTELPLVLRELQSIDFTRMTKQAKENLRTSLAKSDHKIAPEKAPKAPESPQGESPHVKVSQEFTIEGGHNNTIIGYQHIASQTTIGTQILGDKQRNWTVPVILGLLLALVSAVAAVLALLPQGDRDNVLYAVRLIPPSDTPTSTATATYTPSSTPTSTPTPLPTPKRMPAGSFNVVVAGFGFRDADGSIRESQSANDLSDVIFNAVSDLYPQVEYTQGWRDIGVGHILGSTPAEREAQAAQIADAVNADVVIYGLVSEQGLVGAFEPEFYIAQGIAELEPELIGSDKFGEAVEYISDSDDPPTASTALQQRVDLLRTFLRGLSLYFSGDFAGSLSAFEETLEGASDGLEVLYIFAGNAALRAQNLERAFELYTAALLTRPDYSRALLGRGGTLYQMAATGVKDNPVTFDPNLALSEKASCDRFNDPVPTEAQLLALLALDCFHEAELSQDKPETADIDVKIAFNTGQVYLWLSVILKADYWEETQENLKQVITLYDASDGSRQARIKYMAANANAWLGLILVSTEGTNVSAVQQAVEFYSQAINLLQTDVSYEYNQHWIGIYQDQVTELEKWLSQRVTQTPAPQN